MYTAQNQFETYKKYAETYSSTEEHNGKTCCKGRQVLTVVAALAITHSKLFPNRDIVAVALVEGRRGAQYNAYVHLSGKVHII